MLPQARLLAKLAAMPAVTAIVGAKCYPMVVPQGVKYPALCFQVWENSPENSANGATKTFHCVLRLAADLAYQRGPAGVHGLLAAGRHLHRRQ